MSDTVGIAVVCFTGLPRRESRAAMLARKRGAAYSRYSHDAQKAEMISFIEKEIKRWGDVIERAGLEKQ
jgi:hypothetical protein